MTKRQEMAQAMVEAIQKKTIISADGFIVVTSQPIDLLVLACAALDTLTKPPTPAMVSAGEALVQKMIGHDAQLASEVFETMVEAMVAEGK